MANPSFLNDVPIGPGVLRDVEDVAPSHGVTFNWPMSTKPATLLAESEEEAPSRL